VARAGRRGVVLATLALLSHVPIGVEAQVPANVRKLATAAGVTDPVVAWCQGQFRPGQRGVAVAAGGRYLVLDGSGAAVELATFDGKPNLSCYSRRQARDLHRDIQRSETLSGRVVPRFDTTTVCGFVDATTATCWQYSPAERAYVEVGDWTT
jgi:hypothetical protein